MLTGASRALICIIKQETYVLKTKFFFMYFLTIAPGAPVNNTFYFIYGVRYQVHFSTSDSNLNSQLINFGISWMHIREYTRNINV